jgi:hypothetical protein
MDDVKKHLLMMLNDLNNDEEPDEYEYEDAPEECPNGFKWCKVKQMCIPIPDDGMDLDIKLPEIGGGIMEDSSLMKVIDSKMKDCAETNKLKNEPIQNTQALLKRVKKDVSGIGECADTNSLKNYPDQKPAGMLKKLKKDIAGIREMARLLREKGEYRAFFQQTLAQYGATTPRQLDPQQRKEFFQKVNSAWKSKSEEKVEAGIHDNDVKRALGVKEIKTQLETILGNFMATKGLNEEGDYSTFFKAILNRYGVDSPEDLPEDKKKEFFDAVNAGWSSEEESVQEDMSDKMDPRKYVDIRKRAAMSGVFTPKTKLDAFSSLADQRAKAARVESRIARMMIGEGGWDDVGGSGIGKDDASRIKAAQDKHKSTTDTFDPFYKPSPQKQTIVQKPKVLTPKERDEFMKRSEIMNQRKRELMRKQQGQ